MIMKIVNVKAFTIEDVKKQVPFTLVKNATTMWKKQGSPLTGEDFKNFILSYLEKNTKNAPGSGCYIVIDPAVNDTRENPYTVTNIVTTGKRKMKKFFELVNSTTNEVIGSAENKEDAIKLAKTIVTEKREDLGIGVKHYCRIVKLVDKGEANAFTFEYTPSQKAKQGTFLCFGIEPENI